jgi:hypothetical protein
MARSRSRLTAEIAFDRGGKQYGFVRLPYSVHRSAYGWIPIPVACIKNGTGPGADRQHSFDNCRDDEDCGGKHERIAVVAGG